MTGTIASAKALPMRAKVLAHAMGELTLNMINRGNEAIYLSLAKHYCVRSNCTGPKRPEG